MRVTDHRARMKAWMALLAIAAVTGCTGGGGGGGDGEPPPAAASCTNDVGNFVGVCTGFPDTANLDWQTGGDGGTGDGGASGDGGVGAGGDFGQFRNVTISVFRQDGTLLGSAPTDTVKGMVTIRPGRTYTGSLRVELRGGPNAEYFEEGKNRFVSFPTDRVIRVIVPRIESNIGITPFTEAAYQMLTQGTADESVAGTATPAQIRAANARVAALLNEHFPKALEVRNITRLPFIKSPSVAQGSLNINDRGVYGVVNGAFSKQAALYNTSSATPTLDAVKQLSEDLRDGKLDGFNGNVPAAPTGTRTYDPQTLTSELTAALAQQAERFGSQALKDTLPKLVNFGGTRYEGYLFDTSVSRSRQAVSTVAGWLGANTLNLTIGSGPPKLLPAGQTAHSMVGNMGHGGAFFKIDSSDTTATPVYRTYALGDNVNGELGTGNTTSTSRQLVEITLPGAMTHAAGGFAHTVFRIGDGRVFTVGDNTYGQLGQGGSAGSPARTLVPVEVSFPATAGGAVAVAATSVASYALMADGSVYAWGSNGGFGLLGNGQATGTQTTPVLVAGLSEIVQISARDNDVVALKRDQSIFQWGSHPADVNAFTDGDLSSPYRGGTFTPTAVTGMPTLTVNGQVRPLPVRKIITEQGLFGALMANGHVYTWGVHFDLSAKTTLRDLSAARVLGVPPLRDMMPGGFVGYGARPFDRLTAMGVDYSGGMWKIRGRVAEAFDPDFPARQRRPQTGVPRSANCVSCHTFLDDTLETLRARQAAEAPVPANAPVCVPPLVHVATNGQSLIKAETECIQCHNPARIDPRYSGVLTPAFVANGGWPNCNKPTNLPPRDNVDATPITNSCAIPVGHVFTPPGTVCSSCHNSVAARALQDLNPPCAQPGSNELPTLANTAGITGANNGGGLALVNGGYSADGTVTLRGTLSAALSGAQTLAVLRNGNVVGNATASGTSWAFTETGLASGLTATYTVRVVEGSRFGAVSNGFTVRVDYTAPAVSGQVTDISDDVWGSIADGNFATDTTPTVTGTLSGVPAAGDIVQVLRNGIIEGNAVVSGTNWSFTEPAPLGLGGHFYQLRVLDAAGNISPIGTGRSVTLIGGVGTAAIGAVADSQGVTIASGSVTNRNTLVLTGTMSTVLLPGQVVRVLRNGVLVDSAPYPPGGQTWAFTDTPPEGAATYTVRVDAGAVQGSVSSAYAVTVDSIAPSQSTAVTEIRDRFVGVLADPARTADQTPVISGTLSAPLSGTEQVRLRRTISGTNTAVDAVATTTGLTWTYAEATAVPVGSYSYSAQVFDAATNAGSFGTARTLTIDLSAVPLGATATAPISAINGITPSGSPAGIGFSTVPTPTLTGTLGRALNAATGEVVRIYRNVGGAPPSGSGFIGTATVTGQAWSFTSSTLSDGAFTFVAQVHTSGTGGSAGLLNSGTYGPASASAAVTVDATIPPQTITIGGIFDDSGANVTLGGNNNTADTTPRISGTLNAALGSGESLSLTRSSSAGTVPLTPTFTSATAWTFTETSALTAGLVYTYALRVRDAAGNQSVSNPSQAVTVVATLPTITGIAVSGAQNGFVASTTPTVTGSISAALPATPTPGAAVWVYRDGVRLATPATIVNTTFWTFTDTSTTTQTARTYTARVENGNANSATSAAVAVTVDTIAPTAPTITSVQANDRPFENQPTTISGVVTITAGTTGEVDPLVNVSFPALTSGEQIRVYRNGAQVGGSYSTVGGTTFSIEDSPVLNRPDNLPTSTSGVVVSYTARRLDAAGNLSAASTAVSFTINYLNCNQTRAQSRYSTGAHNAPSQWTNPVGANYIAANSCRSCHDGATSAAPFASGFIPAPGLNTTSRNYYWCRKSE